MTNIQCSMFNDQYSRTKELTYILIAQDVLKAILQINAGVRRLAT